MIIAMWSGPRNLSTALRRSFANRSDVTKVLDEPFYAAYLNETNKNHPMKEEVLAHQSSSWEEVKSICLTPDSLGITYQKHMTQHMLQEDLSWINNLVNCFLIRNPKYVVKSFIESWSEGGLKDMGFVQQSEIFKLVCENTTSTPAVIDADLLREDPERVLRAFCSHINLPWDINMLQWEKGLKDYDGIWAEHWYPSVKTSDCFKPKDNSKVIKLNDRELAIAEIAMPYYESLLEHAL